MLRKARGKVLFIDEAYQLMPTQGGVYMQEVVDELVKALTSEEFKDKLVVILAGYESEMDQMLDANQGLRSRFSETLLFENFSPELVLQLLSKKLGDENMDLSPGAKDVLPELSQRLVNSRCFANGRDVATWFKRIFRQYAMRREASPESSTEVIKADLSDTLEAFLLSKSSPNASATKASASPSESRPTFDFQKDFARPPPQPVRAQIRSIVDVTEAPPMLNAPTDSTSFLMELQDVLDQMGLNTPAGVARLAQLSLDDAEMTALAEELARKTGMSVDEAKDQLREVSSCFTRSKCYSISYPSETPCYSISYPSETHFSCSSNQTPSASSQWQSLQLNVQDQMKEQEKEIELAKAERRKALVPIWRCGVCGRADKPYIACFVAPFILRYEEV
jgi:hypothetical protein